MASSAIVSGGGGVNATDATGGLGSGNGTCSGNCGGSNGGFQTVDVDFPLDGLGAVAVPAGSILSPVLTMWITLMVCYIGEGRALHPKPTP